MASGRTDYGHAHLLECRLVQHAAHEGREHAGAFDSGVEARPSEGEVTLTPAQGPGTGQGQGQGQAQGQGQDPFWDLL